MLFVRGGGGWVGRWCRWTLAGGGGGGGGGGGILRERGLWRVPLTRIASQRSRGFAMAFFENVGRRPTMLSPQAGRGGGRRRRLRQQPQPEILRDIGVLIFVHQDELEGLLELP